MVPRPLNEILEAITAVEGDTVDVPTNFLRSIQELYSYPKDEINRSIASYIQDQEIFNIRENLFKELLRVIPIDAMKTAKLVSVSSNDASPVPPSLRKRYKASTCLDDLHLLSLSIVEKTLHKDILKTICPSSEQQTAAAAAAAPAVGTANNGLITPAENQLIKEIHEMKKMLVEIRKENKELKTQLNLVNTKVDNQANLIKSLQSSSKKTTFRDVVPPSAALKDTSHLWSNVINPAPHDSLSLANTSFKAGSGGARPRTNLDAATSKNPGQFQASTSNHGQLQAYDSNASQFQAPNSRGTSVFSYTYQENEGRSLLNQATGTVAPPKKNALQPHPTARGNQPLSKSDEDGFQTIPTKKRERKPPVYGTKNIADSRKRMAGEKSDLVFSLFIGGVSNEFSEADLKMYIEKDLKINPVSISINKVNQKNRSYKVTVPRKDKDIMFMPENWEESIIIKPFRTRNTATAPNNLNGGEHHQ